MQPLQAPGSDRWEPCLGNHNSRSAGKSFHVLSTIVNCIHRQLHQEGGAVGGRHLDLPVFCSDGAALSSRIVLAAASSWMRSLLAEAAVEDGACVILPEISRAEFATFHNALFAADASGLNFNVIVKVAKILGAEAELVLAKGTDILL